MATLLAALALAGASSHPHVLPYGTQASWHPHHGTFASGIVDDRSGWSYSFPVRHPARVARHHVHHSARHVHRRRRSSAAGRAPRGRIQRWLITWYGPTGSRMASGIYPYVGAAACGYDEPLGAHIYVWGIGHFTCLDRIGYQPYFHADLFNVPVGSGYRNVTIY